MIQSFFVWLLGRDLAMLFFLFTLFSGMFAVAGIIVCKVVDKK